MKEVNNNLYLSDEGKVFIHKETQEIMGWGICLCESDSIENYDEVDCPEEYKGNKDYDNTIKDEEPVRESRKRQNIEENKK